MLRARAHKADAMFIFCSQRQGSDREQDDSEVLLQSMALQTFVQKQQSTMPRIIAMVHFSLSFRRFQSFIRKSNDGTPQPNHQVVCLEELKPALMVQGCINPGFTSLAYSMIRSFTLTDITRDQRPEFLPPWQQEFIDGLDYELYSAFLPPSFHDITFASAAAVLYEKLHVFLISVEIDGSTYLAPLAYVFPASGATIHVLAGSASHAVQVTGLSPPKDIEREESVRGGRSSSLLHLQSAAKRVVIGASVSNLFKKHLSPVPAHVASMPNAQSDPVPAAPVAQKKEISQHWKLLRTAVRVGAAMRSFGSSKLMSKDSYQFLLQSDKNPKFARLEAKKSFLMLDEDVPFEVARVARYEGFDHIVFCCKNESSSGHLGGSLKRFIAPLRSKSCIFVHTPVVVLAHSMTAKDYEAVAMYPNVFVVIGNPLFIDDLRRAALPSAKYAVVCSHFMPRVSERGSEKEEGTAADTAAIFAGNLMRKMNSQCSVVVDLQYSRSVKFIGSMPKESFEIGVATASGSYFSLQYFHVLMCRCFYAPFSLSLLQEFLRPHPSFIAAQTHASVDGLGLGSARSMGRSAGTSIVSTVEVPKSFIGCSFGSMFKICASIGIPIAIQRAVTGFNAAQDKYVVSCPPFNLRLNQGDRIVVLSPLPPKELESAVLNQSDFASGMQHYQGDPAEKWQKVYDGVDVGGSSAKDATGSLSSEALLVQVSDSN